MRLRLIPMSLLTLLAVVQSQLWFGQGGVPRALDLQTRLNTQKKANTAAQARNEQLKEEVRDLKEGLEMVEEKARFELGMIKPNEVYVQVSRPKGQ
jgi:cell division protein FtsB